jgi:hypothetical protein
MPNEAFIEAGQHATLLIHEATMADDQAEMAEKKGHSTFSQALDVGRRWVMFLLAPQYEALFVLTAPCVQDESTQPPPHAFLGPLPQDHLWHGFHGQLGLDKRSDDACRDARAWWSGRGHRIRHAFRQDW